MSDQQVRVAHKYRVEYNLFTFAAARKFDKSTRKFKRVLSRDFALELFLLLVMKSNVVEKIRERRSLDERELKQVEARYSLWCRRASRCKWKILYIENLAIPSMFMAWILLSLLLPAVLWNSNEIGKALLISEPVGFSFIMIVAGWVSSEEGSVKENFTMLAGIASFDACAVAIAAAGAYFYPNFIRTQIDSTVFTWSTVSGMSLIALGGGVAYAATLALVAFSTFVPFTISARQCRRPSRIEIAFYDAVLALAQVTTWHDGYTTNPHPSTIYDSARSISNLQHLSRGYAPDHKVVVAKRFREAGASVRDKVLCCALPNDDTSHQLRLFFLSLAATILMGDFDEIPELASNQARRGRIKKTLIALRSIVVAIVPIAVLRICRELGVTLPASIDTTATLATILWAVTSLLMLIDPVIRDRVELVKNITSVFPGSKTEK